MVKLVWHNQPAWDKSKAEDAIWEDLGRPIYQGMLAKPSQLITHTVFLGPSMDLGPVIHIWGQEGDDHNLYCEWEDEIQWVSSSEEEE